MGAEILNFRHLWGFKKPRIYCTMKGEKHDKSQKNFQRQSLSDGISGEGGTVKSL